MAGTTYNTLNLASVDEAPKATATPKVAVVASVIAAVCVMFFAGRVHQGQTALYTHEEVMNVAITCGGVREDENGNTRPPQFIGGCTNCRACASYEFANGGCSFFKDRFCSYCEPIANCQRENTKCDTNIDQKCTQCECTAPVSAWDDTDASCFFGSSCSECSVCPKGEYETKTCTHAQNTICASCKRCGPGYYVKEECTYSSNTVCKACNPCVVENGFTLDQTCSGIGTNNRNDIFVQGSDTTCKTCSTVVEYSDDRIVSACTATEDSVVGPCNLCADGEYVSNDHGECGKEYMDDIFIRTTLDRNCSACSDLPLGNPENPMFLTSLCGKQQVDVTTPDRQQVKANTGTSDFEGGACKDCKPNQFIDTACYLGSKDELGTDTKCTDCTAIPNCDSDMLRCEGSSSSTCSGCAGSASLDHQFIKTGTCCEGTQLGLNCDWIKPEGARGCGDGLKSFRERAALRNGFATGDRASPVYGDGPAFVLWCKKQCESFAQCTAFEVESCLLIDGEGKCDVTADTFCGLKNQETGIDGLGDLSQTCYKAPI